MRAMLRKTLRSPVIFDTVAGFMLDEVMSFEAVQCMSRKFPFNESHFEKMQVTYTQLCSEETTESLQRA